ELMTNLNFVHVRIAFVSPPRRLPYRLPHRVGRRLRALNVHNTASRSVLLAASFAVRRAPPALLPLRSPPPTPLPAPLARAPARHRVNGSPYVVVTLHRPSNVDDPATLRELVAALEALGRDRPVLFPVHPRTRTRVRDLGLVPGGNGGLTLLEPMPYLEMLSLVARAALVVTDSGGLQEETTFLGVPCITVRPNTERPITCTQGTNRLVASTRPAVLESANDALNGTRGTGHGTRPMIERWDGKAAERIAAVLCDG